MSMEDFFDQLPPELAAELREAEETRKAQRRAMLELTERIRHFDHIPRSEAWLEHVVASSSHDWGDEEAFTYLAGRGLCPDTARAYLRSTWQSAAVNAIRECAEGHASCHDLETGETKRIGAMPLHEAERIADRPTYQLRNFWRWHDSQELHIDAAMLRAADVCKIGGFHEWWQRLAEDAKEEAILGTQEQIPASYWLFAMSRAKLAKQLMPVALERTLERVCLKSLREEPGPWRVFFGGNGKDPDSPLVDTHHGLAANVAYATFSLDMPNVLAEQAAHELLKGQHDEGWWSTWARQSRPSIDTTARALLALAALRPTGCEHAISNGLHWLRRQQTDSGYWFERAQPDVVFLTVLVLQAESECSNGAPAIRVPTGSLRFDVALSFPGTVRERASKLATSLEAELSRQKVFYDKFYEAELARPNLDTYLMDIYSNQSKLLVVFVGTEYQGREWCGLEWRAIRDLIKSRAGEQVMFLRVDDGEVEGLLSLDGFIDIRGKTDEELATLVLDRLRLLDE